MYSKFDMIVEKMSCENRPGGSRVIFHIRTYDTVLSCGTAVQQYRTAVHRTAPCRVMSELRSALGMSNTTAVLLSVHVTFSGKQQ